MTNVSDSTESSATAGVRARLTRRGCAGSDVGWKDTFFGCDPSFLGLFPNNVSTTPVAISPIYCIWARFVRPTSWLRGGVCCVFLTVASFSGKQMARGWPWVVRNRERPRSSPSAPWIAGNYMYLDYNYPTLSSQAHGHGSQQLWYRTHVNTAKFYTLLQ